MFKRKCKKNEKTCLDSRQNFHLRGHREEGELIHNSVNNERNIRELSKCYINSDSDDDVSKTDL
jgi:hypothetical protein